jgi:alanine racemase
MMPAAYAVLNLDAVQHNLQMVRRYAPVAKIMAVIKANGYGHGLLRIAEALQNADAFAVARVDEGVRLRKAGIKKRIAVLEGFTCADELDELLHYQLDAVVHSVTQVEILESRTEQHACAIWLKLDTGMNRLGFKPNEFNAVFQRLNQCLIIKQPISLMTHLANADDRQDATTLKQISLFNDTLATLVPKALLSEAEGLQLGNERSIANSAGILAWKEALTDWVRPGVMLYGISPFPDSTGGQLGLKPIMSLHSRLIAVKTLAKGDKVGYSGSWVCEKPTTLGVVAIGYGDGYPRYAKAGTPVLVNGQRVPLIGRVSMDMMTVDLETQAQAKPGDPVTLWGEGLAVEEIALCADTIPYTLVCGVTRRVQIVEKSAL